MTTAAQWPQILRDICRESQLSQRALARASGIHRSSVKRYISEGIPPRVDDLDRLLNALGYELDLHPLDRTRDVPNAR